MCDVCSLACLFIARTTVSQDVQTLFSVQLAFAKFLSKINGNFLMQCQYHGYSTPPDKFPFILDMNLAKANCTENRVCTSCDTVVLGLLPNFTPLHPCSCYSSAVTDAIFFFFGYFKGLSRMHFMLV